MGLHKEDKELKDFCYSELNKHYRDEGWGQITDIVFDGKVEPIDVEMQARKVAQFGYLLWKENKQLREACRTARERFSAQNGKVSHEVWKGNYDAVKELEDVLATKEEDGDA